MIRIIEISPKPNDATSYYRSRGPLSRLEKEHDDISIISLQGDGVHEFEINWDNITIGDILFLSRPATENMLELVKLANRMNIPVWVDYDDLLTNIPKWNRAKTYYDQESVRFVIEQILTMAQMVTVTTPMLAMRFSVYNDNIHIIPNAIDDYMFPEPVEYSNNKTVIWRGGDTHINDLYVHRKSINRMMNEYPHFEFIFLGYDAPFIDESKNKSVIPPMEIFSYFKFLRAANASYNIIPLAENDFNIAKSNISWLETAWAGGLSVTPGFSDEVYDDSSQYPYGGDVDLYTAFEKVTGTLNDKSKSTWNRSIAHIRTKYVLSVTNKQRYELIKDLVAQFL